MWKSFSAHGFVKSGSIYVKPKWSSAHSAHIIKYISSAEILPFLWYLSVIIWEGGMSQRPPGRAPSCFRRVTVSTTVSIRHNWRRDHQETVVVFVPQWERNDNTLTLVVSCNNAWPLVGLNLKDTQFKLFTEILQPVCGIWRSYC